MYNAWYFSRDPYRQNLLKCIHENCYILLLLSCFHPIQYIDNAFKWLFSFLCFAQYKSCTLDLLNVVKVSPSPTRQLKLYTHTHINLLTHSLVDERGEKRTPPKLMFHFQSVRSRCVIFTKFCLEQINGERQRQLNNKWCFND